MSSRWSRRTWLKTTALLPILSGRSTAAAATKRRLTVVETAGLRRFGYPVRTVVKNVGDATAFRLSKGGKAVSCQFRPTVGTEGRRDAILEFNSNLGPYESETFEVEFGDGVSPSPEPSGGMSYQAGGDRVVVSNGRVLKYDFASDLGGFLKGVNNSRLEYLTAESVGLAVRYKDGSSARIGGAGAPKLVATRQGPFAVGLRHDSRPGNKGLRSVVDMTFPNSKSWVEAEWSVEDPDGVVGELELQLKLLIESSPTLVDFGVGDTVYTVLKGDERSSLEAGSAAGAPSETRAWVIRKGSAGGESDFASWVGERPATTGWAHVMDSRRCSAMAVADFGKDARDRIETAADGEVRIRRTFSEVGTASRKGTKSLRFWFHFVPMPVQVGAATSPQAMLAPLACRWES